MNLILSLISSTNFPTVELSFQSYPFIYYDDAGFAALIGKPDNLCVLLVSPLGINQNKRYITAIDWFERLNDAVFFQSLADFAFLADSAVSISR